MYPFILRGVSLLGIDSVYCPMDVRAAVWERMSSDLKPDQPLTIVDREVPLAEAPVALKDILQNRIQGRIIVKL